MKQLTKPSYKIHDGIVLSKICGRYFLLATRAVWNECPRMQELNDYGAFCWKHLESHDSEEGLLDAITREYQVDTQTAKEALDYFMEQLMNQNYIMEDYSYNK